MRPGCVRRKQDVSAERFSHEDVATAIRLARAWRFDGRTVDVADEAPTTVYEMSAIAGVDYPPSAEPLTNPWRGQVDTTLARSLGFRAVVASIHEAARAGRL